MNARAWRITGIVASSILVMPIHSQLRSSAHPKTFTSTDGTFQFSYPTDFQVCLAGKMEQCFNQAYIPPCEDDAIICVVYPGRQFEGSNFGAAAFQVREIRTQHEAMTPDVCVTPYPTKTSISMSEWPEFQISARHPAERIGGILFVHGTTGEAAMSHSSTVDLYRVLHGQKCYQLSVGESETNPNVADPPMKTLTRAQQKHVDQSLSQVLHSFRFLK